MRKKITIIEALLDKKRYFCLAPFERSFGNSAEEIFFGMRVAKMQGKELLIIVRQPTFLREIFSKLKKDWLTNKELFAVECPGIIVPRREVLGYDFFTSLLDCYFLLLLIIKIIVYKLTKFDLFYSKYFKYKHLLEMPNLGRGMVFNPGRKKEFSQEQERSCHWDRFLFETYPVQFSEDRDRIGREGFLRLGLSQGAKYVCIHARDCGFKGESEQEVGFRSANINDYEQAVDHMISRGLWVVRIGDPNMRPAQFKKDKFIDYPFSRHKSELLDLYLIKNCELFIGMDSGPGDVAMMFQKRMIFVNLSDCSIALPVHHGDLALLKYCYSRSRRRFLSIKEILREPYHLNIHFRSPLPGNLSDYIMVENSPDDIKTVVEEKLNQGDNWSYSPLQNEFVAERRKHCELWLRTDPFFKQDVDQEYRFAARANFRSTLGDGFLRKYWEYGEPLEKMTRDFQKAGLDKQ